MKRARARDREMLAVAAVLTLLPGLAVLCHVIDPRSVNACECLGDERGTRQFNNHGSVLTSPFTNLTSKGAPVRLKGHPSEPLSTE